MASEKMYLFTITADIYDSDGYYETTFEYDREDDGTELWCYPTYMLPDWIEACARDMIPLEDGQTAELTMQLFDNPTAKQEHYYEFESSCHIDSNYQIIND